MADDPTSKDTDHHWTPLREHAAGSVVIDRPFLAVFEIAFADARMPRGSRMRSVG